MSVNLAAQLSHAFPVSDYSQVIHSFALMDTFFYGFFFPFNIWGKQLSL